MNRVFYHFARAVSWPLGLLMRVSCECCFIFLMVVLVFLGPKIFSEFVTFGWAKGLHPAVLWFFSVVSLFTIAPVFLMLGVILGILYFGTALIASFVLYYSEVPEYQKILLSRC